MSELPTSAAWRHVEARDGFEVVFARHDGDGLRFDGHVSAVEDGVAWTVSYHVLVDAAWESRWAVVTSDSPAGSASVRVERANARWHVDGVAAPHLDGCLDIDLEASVLTNAFPVHRLRPPVGRPVEATAVYLRGPGLAVERLPQRYTRLEDDRYDYASPDHGFTAVLTYDCVGLVVDYPGLAVRVA